ncbi:MAG: hypothetical protein ACRD10_14290 [Terriglobia bacterium]
MLFMPETFKIKSLCSTAGDGLRRGCLLAVMIPSLLLLAGSAGMVWCQAASVVPNMTGRYRFLGPQDTLAILQEEQTLKGYVDVFQGEAESDAVLSYPLTIGSRNGNQVSFRTRTIHERYYRFNGTVGRGTGKTPGDPDYLQLAGRLETITLNSVTGTNEVKTSQVILKSMDKNEGTPD